MRIPTNLASRPQEQLRPLRTAIVLSIVVALVLTGVLVRRELRTQNEFRFLTEQRQSLDRDQRILGGERQELERWLATPQVQQVRERSGFLNSLILQKSLSWTQMFMDLEEILPGQARITAIRPSLNQSQQAELNLTVASTEVAPLVELLKNLESSDQFFSPQVGAQRFPSANMADKSITIELTMRYQQTPGSASALAASEPTPSLGSQHSTGWASAASAAAGEKP